MTSSSNGGLNSESKWKTDFKDLSEARSLPTYLDNDLTEHMTSSSPADDVTPAEKELQPIRRRDHGDSGSSGSVHSLPTLSHSPECCPLLCVDSTHSLNSTEYRTPDLEMNMEGDILSRRESSPTRSRDTPITPRSYSVDLSLSKIESRPVVASPLDDSLELFTDVKSKASPTRPPRPKTQPRIEVNEHPLMAAPEPEPELDTFLESTRTPEPSKTSSITATITRTANYISKKRSKSPYTTGSEAGDKTAKQNDDVTSDTVTETAGDMIPETASVSSTRRLKFKTLKSNLMTKAYNKYSQLNEYYYGTKKGKELEANSDGSGSEGGFYEITNEEVSLSLDAASSTDSEVEYMGTPEESSVCDPPPPPSSTPPAELTTPTTPVGQEETTLPPPGPPPEYHSHVLASVGVGVVSVLVYLALFHCTPFLQGVIVGVLIPVLCGAVLVFKTRHSMMDGVVTSNTELECARLRKLGAKSALKDFFQYTESHNFGELRIKTLPFLYFKLKGSVIEAYELNATRDQVPDPLKLSQAEIKSIGRKLVLQIDIAGWLVSVEAPPGSKITASNMWKKRYPIWLRKINWRSESSEYDTGLTVNSFYLISPYSRYKEHWYEALRKAVALPSNQGDVQRTELANYTEFMERLFSRIPTDQSAADEGKEVSTKVADMQHTAWVNALFGRFVWNILTDVQWERRIRDRIVRKLSSVNTRHISSIELKSFDLGDSVPLITNTYLPKLDHQGVWTEMDLDWTGQVSLSLVARINTKPLMGQGQDSSRTFEPMKLESEKDPVGTGKLAKLYKILERIEIGVSAQVTRVAGRLCVNIPPPPTDCVWYGFTAPPELKIQLTPIIGRWISLDYRPITSALEKQLQSLFNETFVLPAMENVVAPGMTRDMVMRSAEHEHLPPSTLNIDLLEATDQDLLDVAANTRHRPLL